MSMSDYQYTDGTGALWRLTLPDDFAIALGLTAASNAVPYLPQEISPRYCTYANAVLGLTRACVVPTIATEGTLPDTLTVNSITYQRRSVIGEKFVSYITQEAGSPWAPLQLVGPQGASGTGGGGGGEQYRRYMMKLPLHYVFRNDEAGIRS